MPTLKRLLKKNLPKRQVALEFLFEYYYKDVAGADIDKCIAIYTKVWDELLKLHPKHSDFIISLRPETEEDNYVDVFGIPTNPACTDGSWALDLVDWREWLSAEIDEEVSKLYSPEVLIAHILWEMTFYGYGEDDISKKRDELTEQIKEIDDGKVQLYSMDEWDGEGMPTFTPINNPDSVEGKDDRPSN